MSSLDVTQPDQLREAIAREEIARVASAYQAGDPSHEDAIGSLDDASLRALAHAPRTLAILHHAAVGLMARDAYPAAHRIFDVLVELPLDDASIASNALYAVMDDNHHLGPMPERASRYLAHALPAARRHPAIFYNAALVAAELGDVETALAHVRDAIRYGHPRVEAFRREPALRALLDDARFQDALVDPELRRQRAAREWPRPETPIDWESFFEEAHPLPGATVAELGTLHDLAEPIREDELSSSLFDDEARAAALAWTLPTNPPPIAYVDFLRYSNGGNFRNGARHFRPFFPADTLRRMMLTYGIPEEMPGVLPFAFDGGGVFLAFDLREPSTNGESPIVAFHSSTPVWEETSHVASSFVELCRGKTSY